MSTWRLSTSLDSANRRAKFSTMTKRLLGIWLVVCSNICAHPGATAASLDLDAGKLFGDSLTRHLRLAKDSANIELESGELYEDDGPAAGHSYKKPENRETLSARTWIKKELIIPNPAARAAYLVVLSEEPFEALINGVPLALGENLSGQIGRASCRERV